MDQNITPSLPGQSPKKATKVEARPRPKQATIAFLQLFASNYRVEQRLPQGLQEFIVG